MRLIDADVLLTWFNNHYDHEEVTVGYVSGLIKEQSTIDAVPVEFIKAEMDRAVDDINLAMEDGETEWAERTIVRKATLEFTLAKWKHMCSNCQAFDCSGCKFKREEE